MKYAHLACVIAPDSYALLSICPHEKFCVSPRPRKASVVSASTETEMKSTAFASTRGSTPGRMWRAMIVRSREPSTRARCT